MNKIDRYKILIRHVINSGVAMSQKDFGKKLGYSNESSFSQIINGKVDEPKDFISKIARAVPELNAGWIASGAGAMLHCEAVNDDESRVKAIAPIIADYRLVPMYNMDARGGFGENDEVDVAEYIVDHIPFKGAQQKDICMPISGNSMMPTFCAGTVVLLHEIERWREFLELGQVYMLQLEDGRRIIKELRKSEEDEKTKYLCRSYNPAFDSVELSKSMIEKVFLVTAMYSKFTL